MDGVNLALTVATVLCAAGCAAALALWSAARAGERSARADAEGARAAAVDRERALGEAGERLSAAAAEAAGLRARVEELRARHEQQLRLLGEKHAGEMAAREKAAAEGRAALETRLGEMRTLFEQTIDASAARALRSSAENFLALAKQHFAAEHEKSRGEIDKKSRAIDDLLGPIRETLKSADARLAEFDRQRSAAFAALAEQVRGLAEQSRSLRDETGNLVKALRRPEVRGRYGEVQLERVVELAGMRSYCDFAAQAGEQGEGGTVRPDLLVRLPNGRTVVVDAKTNIDAYLDAIESPDGDRAEAHMARFAQHVLEQAGKLARRDYPAHIRDAMDFTVMFIPGDQFIDAALARRPELLDMAAQQSVILASPSTLIGLLRAVAVGWREKTVSDQAARLFELGRELHQRAGVALGHAEKLGGAISSAVDHYNKFVGSVDRNLMPTLRKFEEAGVKGKAEVPGLEALDVVTRPIQSAPPTDPTPRLLG
ncbi:MAG: DNA recombination protein RmuC [Phycisphaerales bacterium]|nr:DNA recombination protein RmuC [Phycisphaerales bacterium]